MIENHLIAEFDFSPLGKNKSATAPMIGKMVVRESQGIIDIASKPQR
jgi:hypothetical protein